MTRRLARSPFSAPHASRALAAFTALVGLVACTDATPTGTARPTTPVGGLHLGLTPTTTATYTTYDSRAALTAVATFGAPTTFDGISLDQDGFSYPPNPWTVGGVTYSSGYNLVWGPGGSDLSRPISNVVCYGNWSPMQGTFAPGNAYTAFGFDVGFMGRSSEMTLVIGTNVSSYTIELSSVPHWSSTSAFAGIALTQPGEYLTSFVVSAAALASAPCLDNVIVGTVNWSGFFQPVDNPGANDDVMNRAKAGSAIPVKFSLGGDRGLDIFQTGYPRFVSDACDLSDAEDDIEATTTSPAGLTYDPLTQQYTYVWKTDKSWAGRCGRLELELTDGSDHHANFQFVR